MNALRQNEDAPPRTISLWEWDQRYRRLKSHGHKDPSYGGPLSRHYHEGDRRLSSLRFDPSSAALRLWNLVLSEEDRLRSDRDKGIPIVGAMKDVGTIPVLVYGLARATAFYPDGAWWTPCLMEHGDGLLAEADQLGFPDTFCPVRGMLGAFVRGDRFPKPDLLVCSTGAVCDDFSAVTQRLETLGFPIEWWEMPHLRPCDPGEPSVSLTDGGEAPAALVECVAAELRRMAVIIGDVAGAPLDEACVRRGIRRMNRLRRRIGALRRLVYGADDPPIPALEMMLVEALAIHGCSDPEESVAVVDALRKTARRRLSQKEKNSISSGNSNDPLRVYWVNPVADFKAMNVLEERGARLCGADFMLAHAIAPIPEDGDPFVALARTALMDPMCGSATRRADRILREARAARADLILVSRVPGASHSATEGSVIIRRARKEGRIAIEIEVPPLCEGVSGSLVTRLEAALEVACHSRS